MQSFRGRKRKGEMWQLNYILNHKQKEKIQEKTSVSFRETWGKHSENLGIVYPYTSLNDKIMDSAFITSTFEATSFINLRLQNAKCLTKW